MYVCIISALSRVGEGGERVGLPYLLCTEHIQNSDLTDGVRLKIFLVFGVEFQNSKLTGLLTMYEKSLYLMVYIHR